MMYDGTVRDCLPPIPATEPRRLVVPAGSWDTHAHVIGAADVYPHVEDRHFNPPAQPVDAFIAMLDAVGLTYGTLVQVSVHGTDNRPLLEALRAYPDRLRGVAVIAPDISDRDMAELVDAGVRGIRILDIVGGGVGLRHLETLARRCAEVGWHIQLGIKGESYPALVERLSRLEVPIVIDHMGWCPASLGVDSPEFRAVLDLVRNVSAYVKISGYFRMSAGSAPYADTIPFARALIEAAPDRMVWGSDWPHVGLYDEAKRPDVGLLLDTLLDFAPDAASRQRILAENPAALYGRPGN